MIRDDRDTCIDGGQGGPGDEASYRVWQKRHNRVSFTCEEEWRGNSLQQDYPTYPLHTTVFNLISVNVHASEPDLEVHLNLWLLLVKSIIGTAPPRSGL